MNIKAIPQSSNLAIAQALELIQKQEFKAALDYIQASKSMDMAMACYLQALCASGTGELDKAVALHNQAIELDNQHLYAYSGLAQALLEQDSDNKLQDAATLLMAEYHLHGRANSLEQLLTVNASLKNWADMEQQAKTLLGMEANNIIGLLGLGTALLEQAMVTTPLNLNTLEQAIRFFLLALKLNPQLSSAHKGLAKAFSSTGDLRTAQQHYLKAFEIKPDDFESLMAAGLSMICHKEFEQGWQMIKQRDQFGSERFGMDTSNFECCPGALWQGEDLNGKRIFVSAEQGIGDQFLLGQLVKELNDKGAEITLSCNAKIVSIMQRSLPELDIHNDSDQLPDALLNTMNYKATLLGLAQFLRPDMASFKPLQYLQASPTLVTEIREKYQELFGQKLRVGISWQSHTKDLNQLKSTQLEQWQGILQHEDVQFISTQYRPDSNQLERIKNLFGVEIYQDDFDPFDDCEKALAQLANLDLLISVSNSGVHMAGQLGIPTWVLIDSTPLWHWFAEGDDSPWYDSIRLYRQELPGRWEEPLQKIANDLSEFGKNN